MTRPLPTRELGTTGVAVTTLGFGAAGIGNLYREHHDTDASAAIHELYAAGVRYFDTAPLYGFGLSERRLGAALAGGIAGVISTKVGRSLVPTGPQSAATGREGYFSAQPFAPVFDYGYDAIMRSHEESLARLGVPRVDVLLCHDIGRLTHGERNAEHVRKFLEGGYRALRELRDQGAVRAIGLGVNECEICVELLRQCEFDCILLAGRYTLLEQPALTELLPLCETRRVSIICGGPFNSGILATGSRAGASGHYNYLPPPPEVLERVRRLEALCEEFDVPLKAAALQFPLAHPMVASVVAGCISGEQARLCAAMFSHSIPAAFWQALRERRLVQAGAPLPASPHA
jgi:D-threo-aldose 1-dehydrogenase